MGYTEGSNYYNYTKLLPILGSSEATTYVDLLERNKKIYNPTPENKGKTPFMFVGGCGGYNNSILGTIPSIGQSGPFRSSGVTSPY